jgi:hypothetical protein
MKNQSNGLHPNSYNNLTSESKYNELAEISEKEFRSLLLKMITKQVQVNR